MKLDVLDGLYFLRSEFVTCARYIKTWEAIASASDKLSVSLKYNNFFGFIQRDFMYRLIAIYVDKIADDTKTYLNKCLDGALSRARKNDLYKKSKIDSVLKKLRKEYDKTYMAPFRNKRIAHIEYTETHLLTVGKTGANLLRFYKLIAELDHSVAYISHFVRNPDLPDGSFLLQENSTAELDAYFAENDTFIADFDALLKNILTAKVNKRKAK